MSSGALDDATRYVSLPGDPYAPLERDAWQFITVEQAAGEMSDAVEVEEIALHVPVGDPARAVLGQVSSAV